MKTIHELPKAELHVHLEGAVRPARIRELAKKHGLPLPTALNEDRVVWGDFSDFNVVYDAISRVLRDAEDFYLVALDYLANLAASKTLYSELIVSPYVAKANGVPYAVMLDGLSRAIDEARDQWGIETRLLASLHRHEGPDVAEAIFKDVLAHPHPYMVGANIAGDTKQYALSAYQSLSQKLRDTGLKLSVHAGEDTPPAEMIEALDVLGASRIGHGVRCVEDEAVLKRMIDEQIMLEVCPTSNIIMALYETYDHHPLHALKKRGANISINSDDPTFFHADLEDEYQAAHQIFGYTFEELNRVTANTIRAAFADEALKSRLLTVNAAE